MPASGADRAPTPSRPATPAYTPAYTPPAPPAPRPSAPSWTPVGSPPAPPAPGPQMPTPGGTEAVGGQRPPGRPINPFLANDPNQKAKRLARALVSDIVAYHPQLRDQGMRDGTLKQLFRDEIKKSYEEYVDQVGKEFAESTPHFQEALNEVLAGGRRLF